MAFQQYILQFPSKVAVTFLIFHVRLKDFAKSYSINYSQFSPNHIFLVTNHYLSTGMPTIVLGFAVCSRFQYINLESIVLRSDQHVK